MEKEFKPGDKIIWDSHFGYQEGIFVCKSKSHYERYTVDLTTGKYQGICSYPVEEIHLYTDELAEQLKTKYGY